MEVDHGRFPRRRTSLQQPQHPAVSQPDVTLTNPGHVHHRIRISVDSTHSCRSSPAKVRSDRAANTPASPKPARRTSRIRPERIGHQQYVQFTEQHHIQHRGTCGMRAAYLRGHEPLDEADPAAAPDRRPERINGGQRLIPAS
jgi:hypothetical protein